MSDVECPYCKAEQKIDHEDGYGYDEDDKYSQECRQCDKFFVYAIRILYAYQAVKAECLNGGQHNWKEQLWSPKPKVPIYECSVCGVEQV